MKYRVIGLDDICLLLPFKLSSNRPNTSHPKVSKYTLHYLGSMTCK